MISTETKNFDNPDEVIETFNNARIESVIIRGQRVNKLTLQPPWECSIDVKPNIGTHSCQASHLGLMISGAICCIHDDGTEVVYKAGNAYSNAPRT